MIYNLVQYLKTQLPAERIYTNARDLISAQVPDRLILVQDTGGTETAWFQLNFPATVQVITRDIDAPKARGLALDVVNEINNKFGLILPSVTVDGTVFNSIQTAQISMINIPQSIGYDQGGRAEYSTNFRIIYKE